MAWIIADFDGVIIQVFGKCLKILKRRLHYTGVPQRKVLEQYLKATGYIQRRRHARPLELIEKLI
jgi:hypothetical protein